MVRGLAAAVLGMLAGCAGGAVGMADAGGDLPMQRDRGAGDLDLAARSVDLAAADLAVADLAVADLAMGEGVADLGAADSAPGDLATVDGGADQGVDGGTCSPLGAPITAELPMDTTADELPDGWHGVALAGLRGACATRWELSCRGGGAATSGWTIEVAGADGDACVARVNDLGWDDYPVTFVMGSRALTRPFLRCGGTQVSLRADEGELFTTFGGNRGSLEGQWCDNVITGGTSPPSTHRIIITAR